MRWLALHLLCWTWLIATAHAQPADAPGNRLALAREYVRAIELERQMDHFLRAGQEDLAAHETGSEEDLRMKQRFVQALPRAVIVESLAQELAERASVEQLRSGLDFARTDTAQKLRDCGISAPLDMEVQTACMDKLLGEGEARQVSGLGNTLNFLLSGGSVIDAVAVDAAMSKATSVVFASDPELGSALRAYCAGRPQESVCRHPPLRQHAEGDDAGAR